MSDPIESLGPPAKMPDEELPPGCSIGRAAAEEEYAKILAAFDVESKTDADKENVIEAIMRGRVILDSAGETLTYTLAVPIELKNHELIRELAFHEPTTDDLEYINKGQRVSIDTEGKEGHIDLSESYLKQARLLDRICKLPIGVAGRIKRRDALVIKSLCDFFG